MSKNSSKKDSSEGYLADDENSDQEPKKEKPSKKEGEPKTTIKGTGADPIFEAYSRSLKKR